MKLKTVEVNGTVYAEVRDGQPVYTHADGKEVQFDAPHAVETIKRVSDERDKARDAEKKLAAFADLDPEQARKALATVRNLGDSKLVEAGKVDELVKARLDEATRAWESEKTKLSEQITSEQGKVRKHLISSQFATSKVLEKTVLTPDIAEKAWGDHFRVEGDQVVGYRADGSKIYNRSRPGDLADFDEVLDQLIESHPQKDRILRGSGSSGSGATGSTRGAESAGKFDNLPPEERLARALASGRGAPN
jgi:hypothetical protein